MLLLLIASIALGACATRSGTREAVQPASLAGAYMCDVPTAELKRPFQRGTPESARIENGLWVLVLRADGVAFSWDNILSSLVTPNYGRAVVGKWREIDGSRPRRVEVTWEQSTPRGDSDPDTVLEFPPPARPAVFTLEGEFLVGKFWYEELPYVRVDAR
ncbi:MAG: hypothetical protein AB7T63_17340 [Planctomycetota bacterium]